VLLSSVLSALLALALGVAVVFAVWPALTDAPWEASPNGTEASDDELRLLRCEEALDLRQQVIQRLPAEKEPAPDAGWLAFAIADAERSGYSREQVLDAWLDMQNILSAGRSGPELPTVSEANKDIIGILARHAPQQRTPTPTELESRLTQAAGEIDRYC
jgi:hypothetical protein